MRVRVICAPQSFTIAAAHKKIGSYMKHTYTNVGMLMVPHTNTEESEKNALNTLTYQLLTRNCIRKSRSCWTEARTKERIWQQHQQQIIHYYTLLCVPSAWRIRDACTINILDDFDTRCQRIRHLYCKKLERARKYHIEMCAYLPERIDGMRIYGGIKLHTHMMKRRCLCLNHCKLLILK